MAGPILVEHGLMTIVKNTLFQIEKTASISVHPLKSFDTRRSRTNKNRCGKAPAEPEVRLRATKPNTPVYISRLHYTTKAEDIVEYVRQKTRVQLLESHRNVNFKAFVVREPNCYLPVVMEEYFWPQDVVFRRFRGQVPQISSGIS